MPVTLENQLRQMQSFNLPHEHCCGESGCRCTEFAVHVVEQHPRTGQRAPKQVVRRIPESLTLLALERREGLPTSVLHAPEIRAAIARRTVRVLAQHPDPVRPPSPAAAPAAPAPSLAAPAPAAAAAVATTPTTPATPAPAAATPAPVSKKEG